jgi:maleylpyruvate isomerase
LEIALADSSETGRYCHGDQPSLADLCLYAQVWNNKRFDIALENWPTIARIFGELDQLPAFRDAAPPNQPDAA